MFKRIMIVWSIALAIVAMGLLGIKAVNDCKRDVECQQATARLTDATARLTETIRQKSPGMTGAQGWR